MITLHNGDDNFEDEFSNKWSESYPVGGKVENRGKMWFFFCIKFFISWGMTNFQKNTDLCQYFPDFW